VSKKFSNQRFGKIIDETMVTVNRLGALKGAEYAGDDDRLANFRRNAADLELTMESIWRVYAAKHWDAIGQYVRDVEHGVKRERLESLASRCDDLIVYLLLFKAMLIEAEELE